MDGFPYVLVPVFSTPAFSTPAFSAPPLVSSLRLRMHSPAACAGHAHSPAAGAMHRYVRMAGACPLKKCPFPLGIWTDIWYHMSQSSNGLGRFSSYCIAHLPGGAENARPKNNRKRKNDGLEFDGLENDRQTLNSVCQMELFCVKLLL